jgi:hypothetical protein
VTWLENFGPGPTLVWLASCMIAPTRDQLGIEQ